jgi:hypothetical protein
VPSALTAILLLTVPISSRLKRFTVNQRDESLWGSANTQAPPPAIEMVNEGVEKLSWDPEQRQDRLP